MTKKLYVGNLSFGTTESDLDDLFAQAGEVESVRIITDRDTGRSRGFGFVEMSEENAEKAISQFNGTELDGRALTINEARPRVDRDGGGGGGRGSRRIQPILNKITRARRVSLPCPRFRENQASMPPRAQEPLDCIAGLGSPPEVF